MAEYDLNVSIGSGLSGDGDWLSGDLFKFGWPLVNGADSDIYYITAASAYLNFNDGQDYHILVADYDASGNSTGLTEAALYHRNAYVYSLDYFHQNHTKISSAEEFPKSFSFTYDENLSYALYFLSSSDRYIPN